MTAVVEPLADVEQRAEQAAAKATSLRDRIAAGESVTPSQLSTAEAAERLADLQVIAARERDRIERQNEAAAKLERDREAFQVEYNQAVEPPAELPELRAAAITAAVDYLTAEAKYGAYLLDMNRRGRALGFRIPEKDFTTSPVPRFGKELLQAAQPFCPTHWIPPHMVSWGWTT